MTRLELAEPQCEPVMGSPWSSGGHRCIGLYRGVPSDLNLLVIHFGATGKSYLTFILSGTVSVSSLNPLY